MSRGLRRVLIAALLLSLLGVGAVSGRRALLERQRQEAVAAAEALFDAGDYPAAREAFLALGLPERAADCEQALLRRRYAAAEEQLRAGDYAGAKAAFLALADYGDAAARALECDWLEAVSLAERGLLTEAIALLDTLPGYPGAEELIERCRAGLYDRALEATYACRMEEAVARWEELGDYRDSESLRRRCLSRIAALQTEAAEPVRYSEYAGTELGGGRLYYHRLGLVYVPNDAGPETTCMIFYPGGYDESLANAYLTEYVYRPDPPNALMLLCYANGYGDVADKVEDSFRVLEQAALENGLFLHDLVLCGASMGAYTACQGAAMLYESLGLRTKTVLCFDAGMHWEVESHTLTPEQCDSAAKAGTQFLLLEGGGVGMNKRAISLMVAHGVDVTVVECAAAGHYGIIYDAMEYGMIDWALGRGERPVNSNYRYYPLNRQSTYPYAGAD